MCGVSLVYYAGCVLTGTQNSSESDERGIRVIIVFSERGNWDAVWSTAGISVTWTGFLRVRDSLALVLLQSSSWRTGSLETFMGLSHLVPGFWTNYLISHVMEDKVFNCWKRRHTNTGCRRHRAEHSCSRRWPAFGTQHALSTCPYFQLYLKALLEYNLSLQGRNQIQTGTTGKLSSSEVAG